MSKFIADNDKELWILRDADHAIPAYCCMGRIEDSTNSRACWYVSSAVPLDREQYNWFKCRMDDLAFKNRNSFWLVADGILRSNLQKAPGVTPQYYMRWKSSEQNPQQNDTKKEERVDKSFITYACKQNGLTNLALAQQHWIAFCSSAMEWLLAEGKEIDMGFCNICMLPYRENWMHIIASRLPGLSRTFSKPKSEMEAMLDAIDFDAHLASADLISVNAPKSTFGWSMFIQPSEQFKTYIDQYEESALLENTPETYATRWAVIVRRLSKRSISYLRSFFQAISLPSAIVDQRSAEGFRRLMPNTYGRVRASSPPIPVARGVLRSTETPPAPEEGDPDAEEIEGMQILPDQELSLGDMRNDRTTEQ